MLPSPRRGEPAAGPGRSEAPLPGKAAGGKVGARGGWREGAGLSPAAQQQGRGRLKGCSEALGEGWEAPAGRGKPFAGGGCLEGAPGVEAVEERGPAQPSDGAAWCCEGGEG